MASTSRKRTAIQEELENDTKKIMVVDENDSFEEPFSESESSFAPSDSDDTSQDCNSLSSSSSCSCPSVEGKDSEPHSSEHGEENWTDTDESPQLHPFSEKEGLKCNISLTSSEYDVFSLIFDEKLIEKICDWTNARANYMIQNQNLKRKSNMKRWCPTTSDEIKKFLGLCIVMGNIKMPSLKSYWCKNSIYYHPLFGNNMPRNRFENILRCLCFYKETDDKSYKMHKIDQVLNHILHNIQSLYYPGENLSLDEALLLWRGRLSFRQYIPNKKAKYGIKLYELCTPDGFLLNILVYCGKGTVNNENGHAASVVYELVKNYLGKGHTLYMDNYYNSVKLAECLYKDKTHVVGTLRKNRKGNPVKVVSTKLKKGDSIFQRKNCVLVQKWKDKREVLSISTKHSAEFQEVANKKGNYKFKPITIVDYNNYMSGIDRTDQMVSYYSTPRKYVRWYLKMFFHLLDVCIWNSCYIYNKVVGKKMTYLQYRDAIANKLLQHNIIVNQERRTTEDQHFPKKVAKRVRCRMCSKQKKRSATFYVCDTCKIDDQPVGLCTDNCFKEYHTK